MVPFQYLFREHGITPVIYGYIQSAHAFLQLLSGPFLGQLADSSGARTILVMSMTSSAAGMLVMAVATSAAWLIVSRAASVFMDIMPGTRGAGRVKMTSCEIFNLYKT